MHAWVSRCSRNGLSNLKFQFAAFLVHICSSDAGPIPPELGNLAALQTLNLYRNQLSGESLGICISWFPPIKVGMNPAYAWVSTKFHNVGTRGISSATRVFSNAGALILFCPATLSSDCRFHPAGAWKARRTAEPQPLE